MLTAERVNKCQMHSVYPMIDFMQPRLSASIASSVWCIRNVYVIKSCYILWTLIYRNKRKFAQKNFPYTTNTCRYVKCINILYSDCSSLHRRSWSSPSSTCVSDHNNKTFLLYISGSCWVRKAFRHRGVGLDYKYVSESDERELDANKTTEMWKEKVMFENVT